MNKPLNENIIVQEEWSDSQGDYQIDPSISGKLWKLYMGVADLIVRNVISHIHDEIFISHHE